MRFPGHFAEFSIARLVDDAIPLVGSIISMMMVH